MVLIPIRIFTLVLLSITSREVWLNYPCTVGRICSSIKRRIKETSIGDQTPHCLSWSSPSKLTYPMKKDGWKMQVPFRWSLFRGEDNFAEGVVKNDHPPISCHRRFNGVSGGIVVYHCRAVLCPAAEKKDTYFMAGCARNLNAWLETGVEAQCIPCQIWVII